MHRSRLAGFIIDCRTDDLHGAARFWSGALGMATFMPVGQVGISVGVNVSDAEDSGQLRTCPLGYESKKLGQFYLRLGTATPPSCPGS